MASQSAAPPADQPRELTPGDHDVPPFHLGGQDMYAISPDGQELAYTSNIEEVEATNTNNEIFVVPISVESAVPRGSNRQSGSDKDGLGAGHATTRPRKISTSPGADTTPLYSPDGKYLAWRSQARAGFESDKWRLLVQDRQSGKVKDLSEKFDRSVGGFCWGGAPWGKARIWLTYEDRGQSFIAGDDPEHDPIISPMPAWPRGDTHADNLAVMDRTIFYSQQFATAPDEIWRLTLSINHDTREGAEPPSAITHMNDALLSQMDMQRLESFTFKGGNDEDVQGFIVKPPGFDPNKKYPLKFLIHGGPQGACGNSWSYRWNPELFAANGYVVVMINFHGSTGYGQKFTDSISGDWGGKPYEDLMKGLDYVEKTYPVHRQESRGSAGGKLRRLDGQLAIRSHRPFQVHRFARRDLQYRIDVRHDGRTLVPGMGIQRTAVETARAIPEIFAAPLRRKIQDADAGGRRAERLSA